MSDSQLTGTASSYARKYALNGLFLIDDTKDSDTNEIKEELQNRNNRQEEIPVTPESKNTLIAKVLIEMQRTKQGIKGIMGTYGVQYEQSTVEKNLAKLSAENLEDALRKLEKLPGKDA